MRRADQAPSRFRLRISGWGTSDVNQAWLLFPDGSCAHRVFAAGEFNAGGCGQPTHNGYSGAFDGRFYQVVVASGISWDAARTAAEALDNYGVLGQLATINSFAEDEYVHCLIQATAGAAGGEAWIGGFQAVRLDEPADGWQWLNGELIEPSNAHRLEYSNWQVGEPNNDTAPAATTLHLGASLGGNFGWNDEGRLGNIGSYVVEYGDALAPIPATTARLAAADARSAKTARSSPTRSRPYCRGRSRFARGDSPTMRRAAA